MNVKEKLESMLVQHGMIESQAKEVMDLAIPILNSKGCYKITFERPSLEYPESIYSILFLRIKPIALNWIDKNKPKAWFRDIFVS